MKKTLLATAVAASVVAPISAFAVNSAANDLGEVLLYPYYNVNQGNQTFIGVVNTTNRVKVLKVRFREGVESEDVFDFQLWLSPHDHWTAVVSQTAVGGQVRVSTADNSCTVPTVLNNPNAVFVDNRIPDVYTGDVLARLSEGHVEIFEMAEVDTVGLPAENLSAVPPVIHLARAVTHNSSGVPRDCQAASSFNNGGPVVRVDGNYNNNNAYGNFVAPEGGVYGIAAVFNPNDGTYFTYTAEALQEFASTPIFYPQVTTIYLPGDDHTADESLVGIQTFDLPDLSTPDSAEGIAADVNIFSTSFTDAPIFTVSGQYTTNGAAEGAIADNLGDGVGLPTSSARTAAREKANAVTTALMGGRVINDYLTGDVYDTDLVLTFPGRYLYRDTIVTDPVTGVVTYAMLEPFTGTVNRANGRGCQAFAPAPRTVLYGREEEVIESDDIDFSPGVLGDPLQLCYEVNVWAVNDASTGPSGALGSISVRQDVTVPLTFGWADLSLVNHTLTDAAATVHEGMPVIGFAAITERKGLVDRGGAFMHKITRGCTTANGVCP